MEYILRKGIPKVIKKLKILKTYCYIVSQKQYLQNQSFLLMETQWEGPPRYKRPSMSPVSCW